MAQAKEDQQKHLDPIDSTSPGRKAKRPNESSQATKCGNSDTMDAEDMPLKKSVKIVSDWYFDDNGNLEEDDPGSFSDLLYNESSGTNKPEAHHSEKELSLSTVANNLFESPAENDDPKRTKSFCQHPAGEIDRTESAAENNSSQSSNGNSGTPKKTKLFW